ncbi:MAG: hypothetical protein ACP5D7_16015 [Limnospira sp.]
MSGIRGFLGRSLFSGAGGYKGGRGGAIAVDRRLPLQIGPPKFPFAFQD